MSRDDTPALLRHAHPFGYATRNTEDSMRKILLAIFLAVAGCMPHPQGPKVVESTPASVTVDWYWSTQGSEGSLQAAEAECQKYGKHARYAGKITDFKLSYNCE